MLGLLPTLALRHWKLLASGLVLALLLAWGGIGWNRAGHWKKAYLAEHQAYGIFKAQIIDRSEQALTKAKLAKLNKEKEYAQKASTADANYTDLRRRFNAAVLRNQAGGGGSGPAPGTKGGGAGVPETASTDSRICLSDTDAAQIADLAAYAMAAHEWAISLESISHAEK